MALKATIFKANLQLSDIDRNHYENYALTLARHPSETDERMMIRILAFAWNAHERLIFSKGLSNEEEPALWQKSLSDEIELSIEVGMPSEDRIRKACNRSHQAILYTYGNERTVDLWWKKIADKLERFDNLTVIQLSSDSRQSLESMVAANMDLQCTINEGEAWLSNAGNSVQFIPTYLIKAKKKFSHE
jgi:uncharacterized protein YaeQ